MDKDNCYNKIEKLLKQRGWNNETKSNRCEWANGVDICPDELYNNSK